VSHEIQHTLLIEWENGEITLLIAWKNREITKEPLKIIAADNPVTCAIYARENGLLHQPGWKQFRHIAKNEKKFIRMVKQAKRKSFNTAPKYKYGYEIPRTYEQAKHLDQRNGNTLWGDATVLELNQIDEYINFIDKGHHTKVSSPSGYKKLESTWYMTSNMTEGTRLGWLWMDTSPTFHSTWYIP
jgi:hypothetical protein